jgi:succinyl-diaminopimelate desuccinylase
MTGNTRDRVLRAVDDGVEEMLSFAADLVRIPTVNPPGDAYPACADRIAARLEASGFALERFVPEGRPEHTATHPRVNVVGTLAGSAPGPCIHLNGHYDVVPPGDGWTVDPFGGSIEGGRLWGRGSADMKAGLAAALFAADAIRRSGVPFGGSIEVSGTVDEESGGFAGVAHLAEIGRIAEGRTDYVIIPEPFGVDRICVGHRGVYWFRVTARGRIAHGSMPFLGRNAIDDLAAVVARVRDELAPAIAVRETAMPVVPPEARFGSINVNSVRGGQAGDEENLGRPSATPTQTPCVADRAEAVFDRRFLIEEPAGEVKAEVEALLDALRAEDPGRDYELTDLMTVHPTVAPATSPLVGALERAVREVVGRPAVRVASPGTYDQKHVTRIGGVEHCVAYGPGELEQAHQPDESCPVENIVTSARVMAVAMLELLTPG